MKTNLSIFVVVAAFASFGCMSSEPGSRSESDSDDSDSDSDPEHEQEAQTSKCEQALDKVQQCGLDYDGLKETFAECKSTSECIANCILEANCGEIVDADHSLENALTACMRDCG